MKSLILALRLPVIRLLVIWLPVMWILAMPAVAQPPPNRLDSLARGINITGWFRHPGSRDPAALRAWIGDPALGDLARAGFTFVRLAVDPTLVQDPAIRAVAIQAIGRLQAQRLAVVVGPHPVGWHLETEANDRARLLAFWQDFAMALRPLNQAMLFPEILNEPVFARQPEDWQALQHRMHGVVRTILADATIVLTGHDWGSVRGLLALTPEPDRNVVYSVHFYDPSELTALAAYRPNLDRAALAAQPFPWREDCGNIQTDRETQALITYVCSLRWDSVRIQDALSRAGEWARRHRVNIVVGEFGATQALNPRSRLAWLHTVRHAAETQGMGWALWGYDDIMGFAVPRPPRVRPVLDPGVLTALGLHSQ